VTILAIAGGLLLLAGVIFLQGRGTPDGTGLPADLVPPTDTIDPAIPVDGMTMGLAAAPVTLEIYSDFQCPACGIFARETEPLLRDTFVSDGTLLIVQRDAAWQGRRGSDPSYDESVESAAAARCSGEQGQYWPYSDWLFANQQGENQGAFRAERLQAIAAAVGLDRAAFDACLATGTQQAAVRTATDQASAAGIRVTPTLVINGQVIEGAASYADLAPIIEAAASTAASAGS
jgi:protein-disulfide isomerase